MQTPNRPEFTELTDDEIRSILARNYVGRMAYALEGEVEIRPLHYAYSDGRIYGRISPGVNFTQTAAIPDRVAFEVDEVESVFEWRSVIVKGRFQILSRDGADAEEWRTAGDLLRRVVRSTFLADDPVPDRTIVFRIMVEKVTGRASVVYAPGFPQRAR